MINQKSKSFYFINRILPKIPICCSTFISIESNDYNSLSSFLEPDISIIVNLIPRVNDSIIIFSFNEAFKDSNSTLKLMDKLNTSSEKDLLQIISNILLNNSEDWVCSYEFYFKAIKPNLSKVNKLIKDTISVFGVDNNLDFNLFDYWNF